MLVAKSLPNRQVRALLLSLLALAVPALGAFAFPEGMQQYEALLWLLALVPAFLLAYQRGWRGIATSLALAMATLSTTYAVALGLGRSIPDLLLAVMVVYIAITLAIGVFTERMNRDRRRETEAAASLLDPVTSLPNRRHGELFLEREYAAAVRGRTLSIVLFAFDGFTRFNAEHGTNAGDGVLRAFGTLLRGHTRRMNLATRWSSDSFLCVLGDTDDEGALIFAALMQERLRAAGTTTSLPTISAGVAMYRPDVGELDELVQRAEQALQAAASAGGDRVRIYGRSVEELRGSEPLAKAIERARMGASGAEADMGGHQRTACVLLSNSERRRGIASQLEQLGLTVREDVVDGLFPLTSEYDVVAVEVMHEAGRDLVRAVRQRYPTTRVLGILDPQNAPGTDVLEVRVDAYWHERMALSALQSALRGMIEERQRMVDAALRARQLRDEVLVREREGRAALEESEARFRAASQGLSDVVLRLDPELRIDFANPAWQRLTGRITEPAAGSLLLEHIHPDDHEALRRDAAELLAGTRASISREVRVIANGAPARSVTLVLQPLRGYDREQIRLAGTITLGSQAV